MTAVYIGTELRTREYESYVRILVAGTMQKDLEYYRDLGPGYLVSTQMALVMSRPIIERSVKALKLHQLPLDYEKRYASRLKRILIEHNTEKIERSLEEMTAEQKENYLFSNAVNVLSGKISTIPEGDASIFIIKAKDFSSVRAAVIANVVSRSYVIFDLEQQIAELQLTYGGKNETVRKLQKHIERLQETLDGRILPDIEAIGPASVKIIAQAGMGRPLPIRPSKPFALFIAFLMSIASGVLLAFGFDYFDQTFKTSQDVEKFLNIPFLGSIPKRRLKDELLIKHNNPITKYTQSYQNLSNQIYLLTKNKNLKSILLTDAEGSKTTAAVIANLGNYLSLKTSYRVLIIDANLRTPTISKIFNISNTTGLADVLEGKMPFEYAVQDLGSNLNVLTAGETMFNSTTVLDYSTMSETIKKAKEKYEIVLINCADIRNFTDAIILSSSIDGFVLVVNEGKVKRQIINYAIAPLKQKEINIIGVILNNRTYVIPEVIYKLT